MAKRFIRWILPLLVVLTIAIAFVVMALPSTHAAPVKHTAPVSTPVKNTSGPTPNFAWGGY